MSQQPDDYQQGYDQAWHEAMRSDLSTCPWYQREFPGADPEGICSFGCVDEPECQTCEPQEGWPMAQRQRAMMAAMRVEVGVLKNRAEAEADSPHDWVQRLRRSTRGHEGTAALMARVAGKAPPKRTKCNGCGQCCDPVTVPLGPETLREFPEIAEELPEKTRRWILEALSPAEFPEWADESWGVPWTEVVTSHGTKQVRAEFYNCAHYDRESRSCMAYDERPDICSGYPWYDGAPNALAALPPACEFHLDVGRQPVPVEITTKGEAGG